jgi:hypothetical protein
MAHVQSVGAAVYTVLSMNKVVTTAVPGTGLPADWHALFDTALKRTDFDNVREFPAMGTPPNIIKVPGFGSKQSKQVQGQADAPSLEVTINYIPQNWSDITTPGTLGYALDKDVVYAFRFALQNAAAASAVTGLATDNSCYYWYGRIEALLIKPSLTDATTATVTLSMLSDFYGAHTH